MKSKNGATSNEEKGRSEMELSKLSAREAHPAWPGSSHGSHRSPGTKLAKPLLKDKGHSFDVMSVSLSLTRSEMGETTPICLRDRFEEMKAQSLIFHARDQHENTWVASSRAFAESFVRYLLTVIEPTSGTDCPEWVWGQKLRDKWGSVSSKEPIA